MRATVRMSMPIAVDEMVRRLESERRVPWRLAVRADLRDRSQRRTLASATATLPVFTAPRPAPAPAP